MKETPLDDIVDDNDDKSSGSEAGSTLSFARFIAEANTDYIVIIGGFNASCGTVDVEFSASLYSFVCDFGEDSIVTTSLTMDLDFDDLDEMFEVRLAATFRQSMMNEFPSFFTNEAAKCYNMVQVRSLERGSAVARIDTQTSSPGNAKQLSVELSSYTAEDFEEKLLNGLDIKVFEASSSTSSGPELVDVEIYKGSSNQQDTAVIGGAVGGAVGGTIFIASIVAIIIYIHKRRAHEAAKHGSKPGAIAPEPPPLQDGMHEEPGVPNIEAPSSPLTESTAKQPVPHVDLEEGGASSASYTPIQKFRG
ncbi:hypothetical protein DUNSADRAFT_14303 [Dunaliella salina]|uniref:Uncharacterized protein n=1 Tax=Dunaliella salina TaxID=3046 RepID=A0ABQ7H2P4_DUNSA|nr:hypothetical protein DUNSADRAFT_14303 [Dunaliella salina]|eukprot:KAF5841130.1 hypothetical protein DUNSADRAFT_14303 [Dunaliella salina]